MQRKISRDGKWIYHDVPYLIQHARSGTFYVRKRLARRIVQRSLETTLISEAKARMPAKLVEVTEELEGVRQSIDLPRPPKGYKPQDEILKVLPRSVNLAPGRATKWSEAAAIFLDVVNSDVALAETSKLHRSSIVRALLARWKDLPHRRLADLPEKVVREFFAAQAKAYSPTQYNAMRWVFRSIVKIMLDRDARLGLEVLPDPTANLRRLGVRMRDIQLPSREEFLRVLHYLDTKAPRSAFSARLAAYTGVRFAEGRALRWGDVDLRQKQVRVWCAKRRKAASHTNVYRMVPLIPDAAAFLSYWADVLRPLPQDRVMSSSRIDGALHAACKAAGVPNLRFHDLRHYFATRCIESGVDIPTVSRWLGHLDGGVLALRVYGHLRTEHSQQQAAKVQSQEPHNYRHVQPPNIPSALPDPPLLPGPAVEAVGV